MPLPIVPTILLAVAGVAIILGRFVTAHTRWNWGWLLYVATLLAAGVLPAARVETFVSHRPVRIHTAFVDDGLSQSEQLLVLIFGLLSGLALINTVQSEHVTTDNRIDGMASGNRPLQISKLGLQVGESQFVEPLVQIDLARSFRLYGLLLCGLAGLTLVSRAHDLLTLGLALEIVSLVLNGLNQFEREGLLAPVEDHPLHHLESVKFWSAALAVSWFWIGVALLGSLLQTTDCEIIRRVLIEAYAPPAERPAIGAPSKLILLAAGLIGMSLFARMGFAPFPISGLVPNSARRSAGQGFILITQQLAGSFALLRLFGITFIGLGTELSTLVMVVCLSSFAVAVVQGLRSQSPGVRSWSYWLAGLIRFQNGWFGVGLMIVLIELGQSEWRWGAFEAQPESLALILFAQLGGLLALAGIWWMLVHLARRDRETTYLEDLKGLVRYAPAAAFVLMVPAASAICAPWTAGFWGRWYLLLAGHSVHQQSASSVFSPHAGLRVTMLAGTAATMVMAVLVIRLGRELFLELPLARPAAVGGRGPLLASVVAAIGILSLGIAPQLALIPLQVIQSPRKIMRDTKHLGSGSNSVTESRHRE